MSRAKVTVCIATYNHDEYIYACIMSVLAQANDVSLEILIGDDSSSDAGESIVRELIDQYPQYIKYVRHKVRLGPSENYQYLIGQAEGEYIAHLDGDDYWLPGKLKFQVEYLDHHQDCSAVYGNALCIGSDGTALGVFNNKLPPKFELNELLRRGNFLNHSSLLYRREHRENLLRWDGPFLDYKLHLELAQRANIGYLNRLLVVYRVGTLTSVIVHANDHVRELYWDAIMSVPRTNLTSFALDGCMVEFMRSVFFKATSSRNIGLVKKWWPVVAAETKMPKVIFFAKIIGSVMKAAGFESSQFIMSKFMKNEIKILYRR